MKNLILLTETRHAHPNVGTSSDRDRDRDFISSLVFNPNVDMDHESSDFYDGHGGNDADAEASHYVLTPRGDLSGVSSRDASVILWSIHLNDFIQDGEDDYDDNVKSDNSGQNEAAQHEEDWFHLSYNEANDSLVALSRNGTILSIDVESQEVEMIGAFDHGLVCAAWSADKELLALVTFQQEEESAEGHMDMDMDMDAVTGVNVDVNTNNEVRKMGMVPVLMTMNTNFEILSEASLPAVSSSNTSQSTSQGQASSSSISVAWNRGTHSSSSDALIAITSHDAEDDTRKIRFYRGESLEHVAIGRKEDGSGKLIPNLLGSASSHGQSPGTVPLAWAGTNTSNLLACVQRKGRRGRNIVFLEPNGLQHGGFKLEHLVDGEEVVGLDWNAESDLFAVTLDGKSKGQELGYGKVQFYHRNNYHWYLKHEIWLGDGIHVSCLVFDEVKGYNVSIALRNLDASISTSLSNKNASFQEWRHLRFIWDPATGSHDGTVAVVDGNSVNLTKMGQAMIPPPMYASRLTFDGATSVLGVSHVPDYLQGDVGGDISSVNVAVTSGIDILVHLSDGTIALCDSSKAVFDGNVKNGALVAQVDLSSMHGLNGSVLESMNVSCLRQHKVVDLKRDGQDILVELLTVACAEASYEQRQQKHDDLISFHLKISLPMESCYDASAVTVCITKSHRMTLEGQVLRVANWVASMSSSALTRTDDEGSFNVIGSALIELVDGSLFQYSESDDDAKVKACEAESMLLEPCPWIAGLMSEGGRQLIIGLSARSRLYCGERQLCDASSSFILSPTHSFLGYATLGSRSQLRFLPLKVLLDFDPLMGSDDNVDLMSEGYEPRNVERGSTLVAILPQKPSVVLQLPRGNLEGLHPRALVLPYIISLIDQDKYDLALDMMRRQKVDMNLIVDMNPTKCLEWGGLEKMVGQVKNIDHLNLFLASLQNHNITEWKYRIPSWLRRRGNDEESKSDQVERRESCGQSSFDFSTKVNQVCSEIRLKMMEKEATESSAKGKFLLPILSTFAKENPPKLENALSLIKEDALSMACRKHQSSKKKSILLMDHAQNSLKYLAFLADYEILFDTALGMYDFELAKAVARNSQMDPKVYLPMIKRLRSLPEFEAKYEVDVKLKRFESALQHLYKMEAPEFGSESCMNFREEHFVRCKAFLEKHGLHKLGLELFAGFPAWHNEIMVSLGEYLLQRNCSELSLSVFLAAKPPFLDGAKRAARMSGDYRTFFSCFGECDLSREDQIAIATEVAYEAADGLRGTGSRRDGYMAGARILVDYCEDIEGAVDMLISAQMWFEGRRLARLHDSREMEKHLVDAAISHSKTCLSDFKSRGENFFDANKRYATVVAIQRKVAREGNAGGDEGNDETGSLFSLASNTTNSSVMSNASASSVGSVTSVSSVISAGAASTFSLINNQESIRHKSKFNNIGRKKKKKKSTRRERLGTKPGSKEELNALVQKLKDFVITTENAEIISETIRFLAQVGRVSIAKELYDGYEDLKELIGKYQKERIGEDREKVKEDEQRARREGQFQEPIVLECEKEVDALRCSELSQVIHDLLDYNIFI